MSDGISRRRFVALGGVFSGVVALGGAGIAMTWAPEAAQPTWTMGDGMSRVLVVYGTGTGCTAGIAERIGKVLAERGVAVEIFPAKEAPAPEGFDAVLVGSGVRAGSWHQPAKEWTTRNAGALGGIPVAFFTACLTLAQDVTKSDEVLAYTDPLIAETGVQPLSVGLFAGWNEPKRFSFIERTIMKMMKAPEGDFRDWAKVEAWTDEVAPKLGLVG